jgi:hypothetical protein
MKRERELYRRLETYISLFEHLVDSNIQLHVYFSPDYYEIYKDRFSSDKVFIESIRLEDLRAYKELSTINVGLPAVRNTDKDTFNYITCMNSKTEFVQRSIDNNVFKSTHFAWVDFGVFHMIKDIENTKKIIHTLANIELKSSFMVIPTIYERSSSINFSQVNWRFAGSFFFGDRESSLHFDNLYKDNFLKIMKHYGILTWEVNVWEWFETFLNWNPTVYYGSHDDTMFSNIPFDKIVVSS